LDHAEDGRLFRRQGAAPRRTLQAAATGLPSGFRNFVRLAFMTRYDVDFVAFDHAGQGYPLFFLSMPVRKCSVFGDNYPVRYGDNYLDRLTDM
jgi:hypothetical protein